MFENIHQQNFEKFFKKSTDEQCRNLKKDPTKNTKWYITRIALTITLALELSL